MLYDMGASWNPGMSQYNRQLKRQLAGVGDMGFAYRLNQFGPKVGPPLIPANLAGLSGPISWIESVLGIQSASSILSDAKDTLTADLNAAPGLLTQIQGYLTQVQAYSSSSNPTVSARSQALQAQATGLAGVVNNFSTVGGVLLGQIVTAQGDSSTSTDTAHALATQVDSSHTQFSAIKSSLSQLGKDTASLLKDAGAAPSVVQAIENTVLSQISTVTWLVGGGLLAYFLLPSFLPRLAGGIRKAVHE